MPAIITPFDSENFARDMKSKLSGVDLTLEYENIESSVCKVAEDCCEILTEDLYEALCTGTASADGDLQAKALDYLQRSMLHFCMHEHLIFLIARIKDDGVTVAKSDKETTIYKYMQDGLENKLITLGWFWMNKLLKLMEKHSDDFVLWRDSEPRKDLQDIPIDRTDFAKWVGVRDDYFIVIARWIIRAAWNDCVASRFEHPQKTDHIARAMCYEVMGRACTLLAFLQLPEPVRLDVSNELSKSNADRAESNVRKRVAQAFLSQAQSYWTALDYETEKQRQQQDMAQRPLYTAKPISDNDSFVY